MAEPFASVTFTETRDSIAKAQLPSSPLTSILTPASVTFALLFDMGTTMRSVFVVSPGFAMDTVTGLSVFISRTLPL